MRARTVERRWNTEIWYPRSFDLQLSNIPEDVRPQIRKRLTPILNSLEVGVQAGMCWEVAQQLVLTASDPEVRYVEGVWTRPLELEKGGHPAPHAWATVDGHRVDLIGEFYGWRTTGDDADWLYEVLRSFTFKELSALDKELILEGFNISSYLWLKSRRQQLIAATKLTTPLEHKALDAFTQADDYENSIVFKPAVERMMSHCLRTS